MTDILEGKHGVYNLDKRGDGKEVPVDLLKDAAHRLAMYVLQSEAYQRDMDTRDAVDGVLALVMPRKEGE